MTWFNKLMHYTVCKITGHWWKWDVNPTPIVKYCALCKAKPNGGTMKTIELTESVGVKMQA